ncbi:isopeptide-forming domain-containing fimbrial protein [Pseudoxanthomonas wuyuanensis]|nr:isopeptide-forming domain-containing fimbrial protein [Pseudoxanthomonas wuyuanensis]
MSRRLSGGWTLLVLLAALMFGVALPAAANECRLADPNSNGEHVGTICWFQFGAVDEDLLSGTSNVPFEFDLPDGSRVELNVSVSGGSAANPRLTVRQAPTWTGSNFSGNSGFYTIFTPNAAALHSPDGRGNGAVLTLSDIRLYAPDGTEVTDLPFEIVVADAERLNSNPEHLDFGVVSGGTPWNVLEWLGNAPAAAVQQGTPATLDPGIASACLGSYVDCLRFKGMTSGSDANAVVLTSQKVVGSAQPFTVMGQIHSAAGQGFAIGVRCCAMRLRKVLPEGRADPADQFTYSIVNVNDQTVSTGTTTGSATGAYPYISTMAMSGNALTLVEEMAPGSASTLEAYARRIVCVNTRTGQTVLDDTYNPNAPPTLNVLEMGDVVDCDLINTPLSPEVSAQKTADPADGTQVQPGQTITYTLTATVATSATTAPLRLVDTLGAGLTFGTVTDPGDFTCSGVLDCVLPAGTAPGTYALTYTATVDANASGTVGNSVAITENGGDPDPECTSCTTGHPVATAVAYDFCPVGANPIFSIVNGVDVYRYEPGAGADAVVPELALPLAGNVNGMMVDPVRNRLLFVQRVTSSNTVLWAYDAANGGWYEAQASFASPDFPRAGMAPNGIGYMIAGGTATPQVWRVTADGAFGYTAALAGTLAFDIAPTDLGSGDIAFDAAGNGWLSAGQDLYRFDPATLQATRQARPLLNGTPSTINWAGVAFGSDGTLYVANNGGSGQPATYYAYNPATGVLTPQVATAAGASRDLASCAFPVLAEPELSVAKTLAEVNGVAYTPGAAVRAGDVLTYAIAIANAGGAVGTLFPGDVVETLPAGTASVAAGNDFACTGSDCRNTATFNIAANAAVTLNFVVQIDDPLPPGIGSIDNAVTVRDVDCAAPGNDCDETTPIAPAVVVTKAAAPGDGNEVQAGDTITYTLTATLSGGATTDVFTLTDTLGAGLSFGAVTNAGGFTCSGQLECTLPANTAPGTYAVTYTATVDADASGTVGNSVAITSDGGDPDPECTTCSTEHPIALPVIGTVKSANPASGSQVQPGDTITYTLTTTVATSATTAPFVLTDTLGAGLSFGAVVDSGDFSCSGQLVCTLPAGTVAGVYTVTYNATVNADATGTVGNSVAITGNGGDPDPECTSCNTEHPIVLPTIGTTKSANPAAGSQVQPGDTITYTLTTTIASSATAAPFRLVDTLGAGLTFGAVTDAGGYTCSGQLECTLPAGTLPGTYAVTYTVTVDADATGTVGNSVVIAEDGGDPDSACTVCQTEHPIALPAISTVKSANPASGSQVQPGDTLTYTLTTTIATSATTAPFVLTDTLGAGLSFGEVTNAGGFACSGQLECTLPAGTLPGSYAVTYTATVDADATGSVGNSVVVTSDGGDPDPECTNCSTEHPITLPTIATVKTADPADGSEVRPGDTLTYTLTTTIATSATTAPFVLTDTLGAGLSFGEVTDAGAFACSGELECTLPAGTLPGSYAVTYTATVNAGATGSVGNSVVVTGDGGDPDPECATCATEHPIALPTIATVKTADPADGSEVRAGDTLTYTLTTTIATAATTAPFVLTDTLGTGLSFGAVTSAGEFTCSGQLECTLPTGTLPGTYAVTYTATVDADAVDSVGNSVVVTEGGGDPEPECTSCSTEHPLAEPVITIVKSANPGAGGEVSIGDTIDYTLTVTIENAAIPSELRLTDTPGAGLSVGAMPAGCSNGAAQIVCIMAAGTVPGTYTFVYPATVNANATGEVRNAVTGEHVGSSIVPICESCDTSHRVLESAELRIVKAAGVRTARIGDLVRYTLTVENVGTANLSNGTVIDTPPAGFSYVEGSMSVADGDGAFVLAAGRYPLRIGGLDIAAGEQASIVYLLRVGAGVRQGTQVNEAVAQNPAGNPISNVATAQVTVESDPLLDDSLIFGTVFDDRDGDGWQDSAALSGVRVQGGFAADAYIAGSTVIDHGAGPQPVADASAPLLHGIDLDQLAGRQSPADPGPRVVIRQRLREAAFTNDFVLTTEQGAIVRMDASGTTRLEHSGDAAKGRNAAAPTVERRIAQGEGGVVVDYVIGNAGIDERGVPGVRVASVDGLLIETDQYGRYHLADVPGGERGYRNFILKVDPSTLPPGTPFTTDNPLVRRITPGIPVRFDFGVKLPVVEIPGSTEQVELMLGEVIFAPDSAEVRDEYLPAIAKMAEQVNAYGGGEVVISADGDRQALAFDRASAVREALLAQVAPEHRPALTVTVRTDVHELMAGANESGALLGTVLFDTDRAQIRPEFAPLLDRVAARLSSMGGGTVALVGHTDVRGSHAYNTALGMRRARAVYEALAERLSPEVRAQVRVESSNDPTAPVGPERK